MSELATMKTCVFPLMMCLYVEFLSAQVTFNPDPQEDVQLQLTPLRPRVEVITVKCYSSSPIFKIQYVTADDYEEASIYNFGRGDNTGSSIVGSQCPQDQSQYSVSLDGLSFIAEPILVGETFRIKATLDDNEVNSTFSRRTYTFPAPFNLTGIPVDAMLYSTFTWTCHVTSDYPVIEWISDERNIQQVGVYPNGTCATFYGNDSYIYKCQPSNSTYTLTIPGPSLTEELQDSAWRCKDARSEVRGSKFMKLDIIIPVAMVIVEPSTESTLYPDENQTVTFTCITNNNANPPPTILWFIGPSDVTSLAGPNRTTLIFNITRIYHLMSVKCMAWNSGNTANLSDSTTLNVTFPPAIHEELQIVGYTSDQVLYENNPAMINISCTQPGGNPVVNMTFTCGSQLGTNGNTATEAIRRINLTNDRNLNGQQCVCVSSHINGYMRSTNISFTVYYPPSLPTISKSSPYPWKAPGRYDFTCNTTPGNPAATTYTWKEGESVIPITSQTYEINPVQSTDNGRTVSCEVNNNFTLHENVVLVSDVTFLKVEYGPIVTIQQRSLEVIEGSEAVLRCSATGNPAPSVTWYRGSTPVTGSTISSSNYSIVSINRTSTGNYTCKAESSSTGSNELLPDQLTLHLRVFYPPTVSLLFQNTTEDTYNQTIMCIAVGDPYISTVVVQQRIGSTLIRNITSFTELSPSYIAIYITRVSYEDMGTYTCLASNGIPDRNNQTLQADTAYLDVITSAKFERMQYILRFSIDTPTSIRIPFFRNPPASESDIVWTNNTGSSDKILESSVHVSLSLGDADVQQTFYGMNVTLKGQSAVMTLTSFQSYHEGNYTLKIRSSHADSAEVKIVLLHAVRPSPPENLTVQCTVGVATLSWTHSNDDGVEVWFEVLYKEEDEGTFNVREKKYTGVGQSHTSFTYIQNIQPKRIYNFKVAARNIHGLSDYSETRNCALFDDISTGSSTAGVAVGITSGFLVIIAILIAVIVIVFRRYRIGKGQGTKKESDSIDQYEDIQTPNKNNPQGEESRQSQGQSSPYEELQNNRDQHTYDHIGNRTPYVNLEMC